MRLLDRYLGREVLATALFAVITLTMVLVLGNIFRKILDFVNQHNVPAVFIVTFVAFFVPFSLTFSIPWGFLTAVLLVFGRLSASNELTALRTAGLSIPRIARPILILAVLLCGLCLWINLYVAPRAQQNLKDAFFQVVTSDPAAAFTGDQVITDFPGNKIYVGNKIGNQLENVHVFVLNQANQPTRVVYARSGNLEVDLPHKLIKMRLKGTRYEQRDDKKPDDLTKISDGILMEDYVFPISLEDLYAKKQKRRKVESLTYDELKQEIRDNRRQLDADKARLREHGGDDQIKKAVRDGTAKLTANDTELNKRFSFSLACLTFALIGIPLGITAQRQETSIGFGLSLGIALAYFLIITIVSTFREKAGLHPELLIWLPNVLFLLLGSILFFRLSRK